VVAIVLAIVNGLIGTLLRFLTLPLNILTLWLMSGIIAVCMILLADYFVAWFETGWFISAAVFAIVLALINMLFWVVKSK
jgi:putative membrane protein